ncbi:CDP-glycerol glycerophosphotransferase family protein [Rhizobium wenxiniae]|uniref:CDP-glycerol glycerophosphotransferase family protein n=1 Tax=Rhizobium wenxiniae TaxID=1737357 RepID=UPI003C1F0068
MLNAADLKNILLNNKSSKFGKIALRWAEAGAVAAVTSFKLLLRFWPNCAYLHSRHGRWLALLGHQEKSITALETATKLNPSLVRDWELLAASYEKQNRPWLQLEAMRGAVKAGHATPSRLRRLAQVEAKMHRYEDASRTFESFLSARPSDKGFSEYGLMLLDAGDPINAAAQFRRAESVSNRENVNRFGVGHLLQGMGRWAEAAEVYRRRAEGNPHDGELCYRTAQAYDYCYRWEDAILWYRRAVVSDERKARWSMRLGFCLERAGDYLEASKAYRQAIALEHVPSWWFRLGVVLNALNDHFNAADALLIALSGQSDIDPSNQDQPNQLVLRLDDFALPALQELAAASKSQEDWAMLAAASQALIDRTDNHTQSLYADLGYAFIQMGRLEEGIAALISARIDAPTFGMDHAIFKRARDRTLLENYSLFRSTLPIREKTIVYESFGGSSVACSSLALFRHLLNDPQFDDWLHVWALSDTECTPPEYKNLPNVVFITKDSDAYARYLATAGYLINNSTFPYWFTRRDDQKYLNTWHGTPLKTLGVKMNGRLLEHANGARNFLQATHLVTPNAHTTRSTIDDFGVKGLIEYKIRETGYPRADLVLASDDSRRARTKKALGLTGEKPVLFYAPTWRGTHGKVEVNIGRLQQDMSALEKSGFDIVYRGHSMEQKALAGLTLNVKIAPIDIDTNDILAITDVLVTDYSSVFFEFIPRKMPIIFYAYDYDDYSRDRGFYLNIHDMPGRVVTDIDGLLSAIADTNVDESRYAKAAAEFCSHDDGHASERVKQFFFGEWPSCKLDRSEKRIMFYAGPFMANGITASFSNLANALAEDEVQTYLAVDPKAVQKDKRRVSQVAGLPESMQMIGRVGLMPMTPEERWVTNRALTMETIEAPELQKVLAHAHRNEFRRVFSSIQFDAVVHFEGYNTFWSMLLTNSKASKTIAYMHNDMYQEWFTKNPSLKFLFRSFKEFDALVSVSELLSEHNREAMSNSFGIDQCKFVSAPNLISPDEIIAQSLLPLDEDLAPWYDGGKTLTTVGRLSPEKDHQKLIKAFFAVSKEHQDAKLVILGDGPLRLALEHLVNDLGLKSKLFLAGHRANAFPAMRRSAAFVLSSNHEGQPMVLLEAMTLAVPIIATDIPGNRGVLKEKYGQLVPNTEEGIVLELVEFLAGKPTVAEAFDASGYRRHALEAFKKLLQ